jgi:hypothetical protein
MAATLATVAALGFQACRQNAEVDSTRQQNLFRLLLSQARKNSSGRRNQRAYTAAQVE